MKKQIIIDYDDYLEMENSIKYYKENEQNYCKYMDNATTEIEKYKKIIDKAIEYIKEHTLYSFDLYDKDDVSSYFEKASPKDLLNILGGDDNE